jgi:hypothetical protein
MADVETTPLQYEDGHIDLRRSLSRPVSKLSVPCWIALRRNTFFDSCLSIS